MDDENVKRYIKAELKAQKKYTKPLSMDLYQSYKDESEAKKSLRESLKESQPEEDGTFLMKLKEREAVKSAHARRKPLIIVLSSLTVLLSLLMLFAFFPSLPIYGYSHDVASGNGMMITVTSGSLFTVMSDSFYSSGIKTAYMFFFIFQILSIAFSVILLIKAIRGRTSKISSLLHLLPLLMVEVLSAIIGIVCLVITVAVAVLLLIQKEDIENKKIS